MEIFITLLPYISSVLCGIISGVASYCAALRKAKADIAALRESNAHEINRLMEQHKLDIDSLERAHKLEIEKMEVEHKHQLELKQKELEGNLGGSLMSAVMDAAMSTPEAKQVLGKAFASSSTTQRKRGR